MKVTHKEIVRLSKKKTQLQNEITIMKAMLEAGNKELKRREKTRTIDHILNDLE